MIVTASTHARNLPRPNSDSSCWPKSQKKTIPSSGPHRRFGGDRPRDDAPDLEVAHETGRTKMSLSNRSRLMPYMNIDTIDSAQMMSVVVTSKPPGTEPAVVGASAEASRRSDRTSGITVPAFRMLDGHAGSARVERPDGETSPRPARSPRRPGSYQFKDVHGRVIYVGKASNLRQRLSNYFQSPRNMHPRTAQMVATAESVEWTTVRNEVEALMLEFSLIKQHDPRFNVRLRDDKSYPFLAVTVDEQWPRALVMRGRKRKGTRYFGPYAHAYAIRDTLDLLLRQLPDPHVQPGQVQPARAARPAVPAVPHREVRRSVRRRDRGDAVPRTRRRAVRVPRRRHRRHRRAPGSRDADGGDRARVRAGRPAARPAARGAPGDREAADGRRSQRGHRRDRHRRGRTRSGGAGVLRPQGARASDARGSSSTRSRS